MTNLDENLISYELPAKDSLEKIKRFNEAIDALLANYTIGMEFGVCIGGVIFSEDNNIPNRYEIKPQRRDSRINKIEIIAKKTGLIKEINLKENLAFLSIPEKGAFTVYFSNKDGVQ